MPTFQYLAQTREGGRKSGLLEAASADGLESALSARGLLLVTCEERKPLFARRAAAEGRIGTAVLAEFFSELGVAQGAGVPLLTALDDVSAAREYPAALRNASASLARSVRTGTTLAEGMRKLPRAFPSYFAALIEVGERTGRLDKVCDELYRHLRWRDSVAKLLLGASIYPAVVIAATLGLFFLIVGFVLPRLAPFLKALDVQPPLPTRILIAFGAKMDGPLPAIVALVAGLALATLLLAWSNPRTRPWLDQTLLRLPVAGPIIVQLNASRLAHSLALMLATGIDLVTSLQLCEGLMGSRTLARLVVQARESVLRGEQLSAALGRGEQLPRLLLRAIAVGEKTGNQPEMLGRVADYYDRELPGKVQRIFASLYPVTVLILGSLILFMGLGILLPVYASATGVQR